MNNLVKRSLSGIIYIILIVGSILAGCQWFGLLCTIFAGLASYEYIRMTMGGENNRSIMSQVINIIDLVATVLIVGLLTLDIFKSDFYTWHWGNCDGYSAGLVYYFSTLIFFPLYYMVRFICVVFEKRKDAFDIMATSLLGVFYIGSGLLCALCIYLMGPEDKTMFILLSMFILIWLNDTGAYCFGSKFGKHRLCERLSPKKSWEGFWGGMVCCIAYGVAANSLFPEVNLSLVAWMAWSALVSVAATIGDLYESMIKRKYGVKDSGNIIPGHGGILDRIDSLLFVAPVSFIFFLFSN